MRKVLIAIAILLVGLAVVLGWVWLFKRPLVLGLKAYQVGPKGAKPLTQAQTEILQKQIPVLPGQTNFQPPAASSSVQENLKTLNEVQKINQMNKDHSK